MKEAFRGLAFPTKGALFFCLALIIVIAFNIVDLIPELRRIAGFRKIMDHQVIGHKFHGLGQFLPDTGTVGYYTDANLKKNEKAAKEFSHAQYELAPVILDVENYDREFIILNCDQEYDAWKTMKRLGAEPLRRNAYGIILAQKSAP